MKWIIAFALTVLAFLMTAGATSAQEARKLSLADTVTITSVDAERGRIVAKDAQGGPLAIAFDSDTRFLEGGEEVEASTLRAGDRVVVEARKEMEGEHDGDELVADRVLLVLDPKAD